MKRKSTLAQNEVMTSKKQSPWEDTLILAFRDMQWIRKIQAATNRDTLSLAEPPSLLAKLDGNAETVSGDVLTGYRGRFLLLEFKSSKSLCVTEKENKSVYAILTRSDLPELCRGLSIRGHFLVYPEIKSGHRQAHQSMLPIHFVDLMCMPYLTLAEDESSQQLKTERLDSVYYDSERGLDLLEMGHYLSSLARMAKKDGDGAPFKAVIASSDGMFWPVGDLSDLMHFVSAIAQHSPRFRLESGLLIMEERTMRGSDSNQKWKSEPGLDM